jgi:hypothetical protein
MQPELTVTCASGAVQRLPTGRRPFVPSAVSVGFPGLRLGLQDHVELVVGYPADVVVSGFGEHGAQR